MGNLVCNGAMMTCTFGAAPSTLSVLPINMVNGANQPAANIMDSKPFVNIAPFGMCMSLSNPMVAAATAAALGVLTPQPCLPAPAGPWTPGSPTVLVKGQPALNDSSMATCSYGGVISVSFPGQVTVSVP